MNGATSAKDLTLKSTMTLERLLRALTKVEYRGVYDAKGRPIRPYKNAKMRLVTVCPPKTIGEAPVIRLKKNHEALFTPQPTIYQNQLQIMEILDEFLSSQKIDLLNLKQGVEYHWQGRGTFHILPPVIERHTYHLKGGFVDLDELNDRFKGVHVKDANGSLHELDRPVLSDFHIDEVSKMNHINVFNSNASLLNYGVQHDGPWTFNMICDGSHRIDYATEVKGKPITAIMVEAGDRHLFPYYAFPIGFRPSVRLSSKRAESMHHHLDLDKIHLFNEFIKKVLHYDWSVAGLEVSSLRSKRDIF